MAGGSVTQQVLFELGVTGADGAITKVGAVGLKFGAVAAAPAGPMPAMPFPSFLGQ